MLDSRSAHRAGAGPLRDRLQPCLRGWTTKTVSLTIAPYLPNRVHRLAFRRPHEHPLPAARVEAEPGQNFLEVGYDRSGRALDQGEREP